VGTDASGARTRAHDAVEGLSALLLTVAFYGLGLGIILGLLVVPVYLSFTWRPTGALLLGLCIPAAMVVLRAILPGRQPLAEEGCLGSSAAREAQPHLWRVVDEVADAIDERPPEEICISFAPRAMVSEPAAPGRSERLRVMELGLPLLAAVDEAGLRSLIAHELAHLSSGDTRPSAVVLHAHDAVDRALDRLADHWMPLRAPFAWYAGVFYRLTSGAARRRELRADAVAIRAYGPRAHDEALVAGARASLAFEPYWSVWVEPVLESGLRPPLIEGFEHFLRTQRIRTPLGQALRAELDEERAGPYASHPVLRDRLASANDTGILVERLPGAAATRLLCDPDALEAELLDIAGGSTSDRGLEPIEWAEAGARALLPRWRAQRAEGLLVAEGTIADVPGLLEARRAVRPAHAGEPPGDPEPEPECDRADGSRDHADRDHHIEELGKLVVLALDAQGLEPLTAPGEPLRMAGAGKALEPFAAVARLVDGELSAAGWGELVDATGVAETPLAPRGVDSARPTDLEGENAGDIGAVTDRAREQAAGLEPVHAVLELAPEWSARVFTVLGLLIVALIGAPVALLSIGIAFDPDMRPAGRVFGVAAGGALMGVLIWFGWTRSRLAFLRARLELRGDRVTLDHPGVFREPMTVERDLIRLAAIDTGRPGTAGTDADRRFPIGEQRSRWALPANEPIEPLGWLWTAVGGSPLPFIGVTARRPNLAILFERPVAAPPLRRETVFGPLEGEGVVGLLLAVRSPETALRTLSEWGVVREVVEQDAEVTERGLRGDPLPEPAEEEEVLERV